MSSYNIAPVFWVPLMVATAPDQVCQINDCKAPANFYPHCNTSVALRLQYSVIAKQSDLKIANRDHLFNFINDPAESDCVAVDLRFGPGASLYVHCQISEYLMSGMSFKLNSRPPPVCFNCQRHTQCGVRSNELLRLTLFPRRKLLLVEDFSEMAPKGAWLLLKEDDRPKQNNCKCPRWAEMLARAKQCEDAKVAGRFGLTKSHMANTPAQKDETFHGWIIGAILCALLAILGSFVGWKICSKYARTANRKIQSTKVTVINVKESSGNQSSIQIEEDN